MEKKKWLDIRTISERATVARSGISFIIHVLLSHSPGKVSIKMTHSDCPSRLWSVWSIPTLLSFLLSFPLRSGFV